MSRLPSLTWLSLTVLLVSPTLVEAQNGADDCNAAPVISEGAFNADTSSATDDSELPCGAQGSTPDVHFDYAPSCDGLVTASTCVSNDPAYDSIITVWSSGTTCGDIGAGSGVALGCNDDALCGALGFNSEVTVPVTAGGSYFVTVAGWSGLGYNGTVELACIPSPIENMSCGSVPGTDVVDATWTNPQTYDELNVFINGVFVETLAGTAVSYSSPTQPPLSNVVLCIEGVAGGASSPQTCCNVNLGTADVDWDPPADITGPTDIITMGTLIEAVNCDDGGPVVVDPGGLNMAFDPDNTLLANNPFTTDFAPLSFDPGFNQVMNRADWSNPTTSTVTIDGLVPGEPYVIQMFVADTRNCCGMADGRSMEITGGANSTTVFMGSIGGVPNPPQYVIGRFTALSDTQEFVFVGTHPTAPNLAHPQLNAYVLRLDDPVMPTVSFLRADADGDGDFVGLIDALYILAFQFQGGPAPMCLESGDADGDSMFNGLVDTLYILVHQFQGGPPPPPPYPDCGEDPDPAMSLGCDPNACP